MGAEKDSGLAAGALVFQKSHSHERLSVSLQFGEVIMTLLLFFTAAWMLDNSNFVRNAFRLMLIIIVEASKAEARRWRLTRMRFAATNRVRWFLFLLLY